MKEIYFLKVSQLQLWHQPFCIGRLQSILRTYKQLQEHIDNRPYSQSYGLSSSHAWVWEQDHKEDWVPKNWCFRIVLQKTLESPLDCKEDKPVSPHRINLEYSLEGLMLKLKLQYFGHLMWRADSLEKILMLGNIEVKRRRGWQRRGIDSIINSMDTNVSKLQEIVKDRGAWHAQSIGSQRVAKSHDLAAEQQQLITHWERQLN